MTGRKVFAGRQVRRAREQRKMSQSELARAAALSPSYLNQIEHDRRPLTAGVLDRLAAALELDASHFDASGVARLAAELAEALVAERGADAASPSEIRALATEHPEIAKAVVALHRRYRDARGQVEVLAGASVEPTAYEQVRDFFYLRDNYIGPLDVEAEKLALDTPWSAGRACETIIARLARRHGIAVVEAEPTAPVDDLRHYDRARRTLAISCRLPPPQRAFQLATQLALVEHADTIAELCDTAHLSSPAARDVARLGLANYFAGAVLLPYGAFLSAAERLRYDVELLAQEFGVGFESACHRLSTLQRPGAAGVAWSFVRVDRAGNVSKRQSASSLHLSRVAGSCPLWNVHEAFSLPGRVLVQVAEMPDGRRYLWVARAVSGTPQGFARPARAFAVGLGCDIRHARRLVYADGLDLSPEGPATPIGPGCKVCDRSDCAQRAFPPAHHELAVDPDRARSAPYSQFRSTARPV